jgi:glycosyltransferase 2 family protein
VGEASELGQAGTTPEIVEAPAPSTSRSPADVLRLVVAAVLLLAMLLMQWLVGDTLTAFAADLLRGIDALPTWIVHVVIVGTRVLVVVVLVAGLAVTLRHGRWRMLLTVAAAALLAGLLTALLEQFDPESEEAVIDLDGPLGPLQGSGFPSTIGVAAASAVLAAAAPWLSRGWRRLGWVLVMGLTLTRFLASPISFDSVRALLVGWFAGAVVLVVLGGPQRRPTGAAIADGLAAVGLPLARLEQASVDARGSTPYFGTSADGSRLFVKALGQDQRSADLLFRLYRSLTPRNLGDEKPFSTLRRAVEHEALVALAARDMGIRTPRLEALTTAEPHAFVLAYEAIEGRSLDRLQPDEVTDALLASIWGQVVAMRSRRVAHRDLRLANIFMAADGEAWIIDFGFSELAASDVLLATDVAELLASSALQVGPERAVAQGRRAVGPDALGDALGRLHRWALGGATRTALGDRPGLLDTLREQVAASAAPARAGSGPP